MAPISTANLLTRLGGARNCLLVYVAEVALTITPVFPFNLMFLPEVYGLEVTAPLADVTVESVKDGLLGKRIILAIRGPKPRRFALWVKDRDGFRAALEGRRAAPALAKAGARPRRPGAGLRTIIFRLFALVWGLVALTVSVTGLREDLRFRSQGVAVTGQFTAPPVEDGASNRMGIVSYQVEGATYQLTSLRGSALYRLGETDRLRYLPTHPGRAREDDNLGFELLFGFMGGVMLTLGVAFG